LLLLLLLRLLLLLLQTFEIDASAAEKPVEAYDTLQAFFTRRLKPGLRPLAAPG
jgi:phosphatidylserine decarboxylase